MSKSYKKFASGGICYGSNAKYYRERSKNTRNKNKHIIRNTLAKHDFDNIDDFEFIENKRNPNYDCWNEPTDGKWYARTFREYLLNKWIKFLYYKERDIKEHLRNFQKCKIK